MKKFKASLDVLLGLNLFYRVSSCSVNLEFIIPSQA